MNTETKYVLVPVDFSEQSLVGLEQSYNLARLSSSKIVLLHVIKSANLLWGLFSDSEKDNLTHKIEDKLSELAVEVRQKSEVECIVEVRKGKIVETILQVAEEYDVNFIVMGTTPSENITRMIISYSALRIVKESVKPVITIKGIHHRNGCQHIVLPLDLTLETRQKVSNAIEFARLFGSKIFALSVITTNDPLLNKKLALQHNQVTRYIERTGIECVAESIQVIGNDEKIAKKVIEFAHSVEGDLIIVMTQQETDITDYFLSSPTQELIYHSDIPVLSIVPNLKFNYNSLIL